MVANVLSCFRRIARDASNLLFDNLALAQQLAALTLPVLLAVTLHKAAHGWMVSIVLAPMLPGPFSVGSMNLPAGNSDNQCIR